jgi:hypothetical protein
MQRDFLGTGWSFPVEPDATGDVELSSGEADVAESIWIVLGTAKGERTMRTDFGCGIHEYVFATVNTTTLNLIETSVREALIRWEPRIEVQNVEIRTDEIRTGKLLVDIDYRIRSSNTEANLVYPFYLEE